VGNELSKAHPQKSKGAAAGLTVEPGDCRSVVHAHKLFCSINGRVSDVTSSEHVLVVQLDELAKCTNFTTQLHDGYY